MFQDGEYIDSYRRAVQSRLLSFCEAKYLPCDVETTVDVRQLYNKAAPKIFKSNNPRVLIVMKNYFNGAATAIMMNRFGCKTVIARSGREAYRKYLRNNSSTFHLVIVQWDLDDIGGRDLVHYERARGGELVFLAAVPERMSAEEVIRSGADLFLRMPLCIHMHVLRGLLLPNLQSSYAFPVAAMKLRPNHQVLKNLLETLAAQTTMNKETEEVVKEAKLLLYATQDAVLDANLEEFNNLLGKLKKTAEAASTGTNNNNNNNNNTGTDRSLLSPTKPTKQSSLSPVHPLRASNSNVLLGSSSNNNTLSMNAKEIAHYEKIDSENHRLTSAFSAALKTFNDMKSEITQLMIHRQQLKRLLTKKPELEDIVSPFDPGAAIEAMERPELYRVIAQLRHHVANLLSENEQVVEDYERICHFKVELEEDLNAAGVGVVFHDVENVTVAQNEHVVNYVEHALKLLMSGDVNFTEDKREELRREASAQLKIRRKSVTGKDGRRYSVSPGDNTKKVSFTHGNDGRERKSSLFLDQFSSSGVSSGNPTPQDVRVSPDQQNLGKHNLLHQTGKSAKHQAILLFHAQEELALTRQSLEAYERNALFSHDKYLQTINKIKPNVPPKIPFFLDPIRKSTAPNDVAFDNSIEFVQRVLEMSHSFVERTVTVTPSLFSRAEEFLRTLNKALLELNLGELREKVDEYIRDRNIRERTALTESFGQLKLLREQFAKEKNLPVQDLVLIRKAEVLRRQAARSMARSGKIESMFHCFRAWGVWAKNKKILKNQHSHVLELQAFQVTTERESRQLRVNFEEEKKNHRLLAVENAKNTALLADFKKEIEKFRAQDVLKDRAIVRLNEKLLSAVAFASKEGNQEQLRLLTVGKERAEIGIQTDADVNASVSFAILQQQQKSKQKQQRNLAVSDGTVQCNLLSDETLEKTIDYAIRQFISATKNMWEPPNNNSSNKHNAKSNKNGVSKSSSDISVGESKTKNNEVDNNDDEGGEEQNQHKNELTPATETTTTTTTTAIAKTENDQENSSGEILQGSEHLKSNSNTTASASDDQPPTQDNHSGKNKNSKGSAALSKFKSKAQHHWDMIVNQSEMKKIMKQVAKQAISEMAPATAALNEEREKLSASLRSQNRPMGRSMNRNQLTNNQNNNNGNDDENLPQDSENTQNENSINNKFHDASASSSVKKNSRRNPNDDDDDDDAETNSWAVTSTPIGKRMNDLIVVAKKVETAEVGVVTDEHGLGEANASADEIAAARSGISRRKLQQEKEAARFPTITEAAKSVNELQRFSKVTRDVFGVDLHFYFETANPTTLEVVREVIRGLSGARLAINRGEYSRQFDQNSNNNGNIDNINTSSPSGVAGAVGEGRNRSSPMSKSTTTMPAYQRLYYSSNNNNNTTNTRNYGSTTNSFPNVKLDTNNNSNANSHQLNALSATDIDNLLALLQQQQNQPETRTTAPTTFAHSTIVNNRADHEKLLSNLLNRNFTTSSNNNTNNNNQQKQLQPRSISPQQQSPQQTFSPQPPSNQQQQNEPQFYGRRSKSLVSFHHNNNHSSTSNFPLRNNNNNSNIVNDTTTAKSPQPNSSVPILSTGNVSGSPNFGRRQQQQQQFEEIGNNDQRKNATFVGNSSLVSSSQQQQNQQQNSARFPPGLLGLPQFLPVGTSAMNSMNNGSTRNNNDINPSQNSNNSNQSNHDNNAKSVDGGIFTTSTLLQNLLTKSGNNNNNNNNFVQSQTARSNNNNNISNNNKSLGMVGGRGMGNNNTSRLESNTSNTANSSKKDDALFRRALSGV